MLLIAALGPGLRATARAQDAAALEEQYKTCAKHYIPADKCTAEIYNQLKDKDSAPLDPTTALALRAAREYQRRLKNPSSMQLRTAYVTNKGYVCLEISAQNGFGGSTMSQAVYTNKGTWLETWTGFCVTILSGKLYPGTDVTSKVKQALAQEN